MSGAFAWQTLITRNAPNTAAREQSLVSVILNAESFSSYFYSLRDRVGDSFNAMKKALFLDKAQMTVRAPLQMQNLDLFEAMAAVTLQLLQLNEQYSGRRDSVAQRQKWPRLHQNSML